MVLTMGMKINLVELGFNGGAVYIFGTSSRYGEHKDSVNTEHMRGP